MGEGWTDDRICQALDTNESMVTRVRRQLVEEGMMAVLSRKKRTTPPIQPIFDGEAQARLTAWPARSRHLGTPAGASVCWPTRWWN